MIEVVLEMHSTSVDNEAHVASGHGDAPLSATGKIQAEELGRRYPPGAVQEVFCSDLERSYRTAEIAFRGRTDITVHTDSRLRECNYGDWNRMDRSRIDSSRASRIDVPFPNGESYRQCTTRAGNFLAELWKKCQHPRILIIGHRATHYALESLLNGKPLEVAIAEEWAWRPGWTYSLSKPLDV